MNEEYADEVDSAIPIWDCGTTCGLMVISGVISMGLLTLLVIMIVRVIS